MNKIIRLLILFSLIIINFIITNIFIVRESIPIKNRLNKLDLKDVNNLMIIAHPDDESLWGGAHLSKKDYLVVCVTCGVVEERKEEFEKAMKEFDNKYISLGYPDKTNNKRDDWSKVYYKIEKDIKDIIDYKDWNTIVTHNPNGEYNHEHHKMISTMVTLNSNKKRLYYFNKYYTDDEINYLNYCMKELSERELYNKSILLNDYISQQSIIDNHYINIKYENFILYENWG